MRRSLLLDVEAFFSGDHRMRQMPQKGGQQNLFICAYILRPPDLRQTKKRWGCSLPTRHIICVVLFGPPGPSSYLFRSILSLCLSLPFLDGHDWWEYINAWIVVMDTIGRGFPNTAKTLFFLFFFVSPLSKVHLLFLAFVG